MRSYPIAIILTLALLSASGLMAQTESKEKADTTAAISMPAVDSVTKTETPKAEKKKKHAKADKKETKTDAQPQAVTPVTTDSSALDSTKAHGKKAKKQKNKKEDPALANGKTAGKKMAKKPEPAKPIPHAKPGAEAEANAKVKDPIDRTRKGPSGQKVYLGPRGSIYYINSNGQKIFIKQELPK